MKNFEDEPRDTNNAPNEDFVDPTETGETVDKKLDAEVSGLFEDARGELEKIDANAERQKKQIVIDLAKDLEDKIRTDSICMEIIDALRGRVSPGFIRECLDEKYKQKHRIANARKQKRQQQQEPDPIDNSAKATTLNQEAEKKKTIILGADGHAMLQEEEDNPVDEGADEEQSTITIGSSITKDGVQTNHRQEQQEEPEHYKYSYDYLNMKGPSVEDVELDEEGMKSTQSIGQDEAVDITTHDNKLDPPSGDYMSFEFPLVFRDLRNHMATMFKKEGDRGKVWFSGKINKRTGKVVDAGFGKIS